MPGLKDPSPDQVRKFEKVFSSLPGASRFDDWEDAAPSVVAIIRDDAEFPSLTALLEGRPHYSFDSDPGYVVSGIYLLEPYLVSWVEFLAAESALDVSCQVVEQVLLDFPPRRFADLLAAVWDPAVECPLAWDQVADSYKLEVDVRSSTDVLFTLSQESEQSHVSLDALVELFVQFRKDDSADNDYRYGYYAEKAALVMR